MRSGTAQRVDGAPGVTRRVVRLFVLLGALVAAYLVLSLFDHAARADGTSIDQIGATDPVASVKAAATDASKAVREPKSVVPKSTAPKAHQQRSHQPTMKRPAAHRPKIQAPRRNQAPKIAAPRKIQAPIVRAGETVRHAAAAVTTARTAVVRQKLPTLAPVTLPDLPDRPQVELPALPHLPSVPQLSSLPQLPSWPQLPGLPQAQLPAWPQLPGLPQAQLPAWPQPPSWSQLPGLPQAHTAILAPTTALLSTPVPHQPLILQASGQVCPQPPALAPASGLSGVSKPPAAAAPPRTAPLPAPPRQPADRSTSTGHARDSGGGNAPAMGTVSSSWRPEVTAAGPRPATDLIARGRTVRYAGPPS